MQYAPVTIAERLAAIVSAAMVAFVLFGIATLLHHAISRNDERKRIQGRPIRWWVTGLYMVGAIAGVTFADNKFAYMYEAAGGFGGFGLLAGLLIGNLHGGINLMLSNHRIRNPKTEMSPLLTEKSVPHTNDDGNPYAPPLSTGFGDELGVAPSKRGSGSS